MGIETRITQMLGIQHPILSAPMGPFFTTKLTVAVSEAGGLGVLSHINLIGMNSIEEMKKGMEYVVEHTDKPFGFNIRTARLQPDAIKLCRKIPQFIMANPRIREQCVYLLTSAGSPRLIFNRYYEKLRESGSQIKHFHVVPNIRFAEKCVDMGVDGLVVTGIEGGGHQSYEKVSTLVLLQEIRKKFADIPIIACGGFVTGEGLASALSLGAGAIAMGSRFIASKECEFHNNIKNVAVTSGSSDTELVTGLFGPIRVLKNNFTLRHKLVSNKEEKLQEENNMSSVVEEMKFYEKTYNGDIKEGAVLLGQSIGVIDRIENVSDIINSIIFKAQEELFSAFNKIKRVPVELELMV
ncbi:MAG: NAD(P)H-dependent flavin oxidoreductase [Promethearchaeota archaeon]